MRVFSFLSLLVFLRKSLLVGFRFYGIACLGVRIIYFFSLYFLHSFVKFLYFRGFISSDLMKWVVGLWSIHFACD